MPTACGDIITIVRDQIPDPVYASGLAGGAVTGDSLPQVDGNLFRSQTLVRWVNEGVKVIVEQTGYYIEDILPITVTTNQPYYDCDSKWQAFDQQAWYKQFAIPYLDLQQQLGPFQLRGSQASWWGYEKKTDHLTVAIQPIPSLGDQITTISSTYNAGDGILQVSSAVSFNTFGWVQVTSGNTVEILSYQTVSGSTKTGVWQLMSVVGAQSGTASNNYGVNGTTSLNTLSHMGLWLKGRRMPQDVTSVTGNTGLVELPIGYIYPLQLYVLWKCRTAENDYPEAGNMYKLFTQEMEKIKANAGRTIRQGLQVQAYGSSPYGPLYNGNLVIR